MAAGRRGRPAGFSLPLTMALAFSLMSLATAIVGMVVVSDKQAKAAADDLVTRTTLESAIEASLFSLERDGEPEAREWTDRQTLNGRDIELTFAPARFKPDLNKAEPQTIAAALSDPDLRDRVTAALTPPKPTDKRPAFDRMVDLVHAVGAAAAEEDCLRRRLAIGRKSGDPDPSAPETALIPPRDPLAAGEVIDVRAETRDWEGRREVLWRRVRFLGKPQRAWLTHDWREMRLPRGDVGCLAPAPVAPPSVGATAR